MTTALRLLRQVQWVGIRRSFISGSVIMALLFAMPARTIGGLPSHAAGSHPPEYTFKIVRDYPHDPAAFTQGLVYHGGFLYEGTGLNGQSQLRKVLLETGEVLQHIDLSREYFG